MMLDRAAIAARIPHQGEMCLLDAVLDWDAQRIRCSSSSHRKSDNPLRSRGELGAACGIEYAAQAMAMHGALLADPADRARAGYLTSVRGVSLNVARLDDIADDLDIEAVRFSGDDNHVLYDFTVQAGGKVLLSGRAAVVLDTDAMNGSKP